MLPRNEFILVVAALLFLLPFNEAESFDYPAANISSQWTNSPALEHIARYADGAMMRAVLLRGSFGPSFACGFFCSGACTDFHLSISIVYTNSGSRMTGDLYASPQVVWSANRNRPVKENATLKFEDGSLVLRDVDGTLVWSTDTSGRPVVGMNLTGIGNLELVDDSNSPVWSSIDHPTDSWVLGQTLRQGQRLTANVSASNCSEGQVSLSIVNGGFVAYVGSNPPQMYYQNVKPEKKAGNRSTSITFANGSLAILPDFNVYVTPASSLQYMRLDYGGRLRLYEWNSTGWIQLDDVFKILEYDVYATSADECGYPTVCGEYGICSNGQCSCPAASTGGDSAYFRQIDERQPNLGCSPLAPLSCTEANETHRFIALKDVAYFNYIDDHAAAMQGADAEMCKQACLMNCSCKAALFLDHGNASAGSCYLPSQLFSMKNNKPAVSHFNSSAYIKVQIPLVPPSNPPSDPKASQKKSVSATVIVGVTLGVLFAASLAIGYIFVRVRRKKDQAELEDEDRFDMVPGIPMRFSLEELKAATDNFCKKLGEGGFGSVFEGTLGDGTKVAVKRLDGVGQGKKEFLAEVETIGSVHHINLVRLIGFCAEKSFRLLVYEHMCNGSLDKWVFNEEQHNALQWQTRRKIITDVAKGLAYLHEECRQKIVHLDIKPPNILLDEEFNAKVSDFGLSKLIDRDQSQVMTRMRGTPGYLAPEWLTSLITEKADVYSFGVVVMEIVCGRKNLDRSQTEECFNLINLLQHKVQENRLSDIISHGADMQLRVDEIVEMIKLAMWCLQSDSNKRPSMSAVVKVLEGSMKVESDIDCKFFGPSPIASQNANKGASASPSAWLLSGPR